MVLVVSFTDTEEEAIKLANDTIYGLAGAVFTGDGKREGAAGESASCRRGFEDRWINYHH